MTNPQSFNQLTLEPFHRTSPWPHRLAVLLACATFPLVWVGGLVTSTDAGMAVPDWPTTYGYNLLVYPWRTWVFGPWDLFVEHGHRLLGALVGLLTIAVGISLWRCDDRRVTRWLALASLVLVVGQGVLGGLRVVWDERMLALMHGCVGPIFFSMCVAMAVLTSRAWQSRPRHESTAHPIRSGSLPLLITAVVYAQIFLGAMVRHMPPAAEPAWFRTSMLLHVAIGVLLIAMVTVLVMQVLCMPRSDAPLSRSAWLLGFLVVTQIGLGAATWVVQYGWPAWLGGYRWAAGYTVRSASLAQTHVVTAHAATGSLILGTSLMVTLFGWRCAVVPSASSGNRSMRSDCGSTIIRGC
jgi:cytochrome c oxidase assembly protein subunit 15